MFEQLFHVSATSWPVSLPASYVLEKADIIISGCCYIAKEIGY